MDIPVPWILWHLQGHKMTPAAFGWYPLPEVWWIQLISIPFVRSSVAWQVVVPPILGFSAKHFCPLLKGSIVRTYLEFLVNFHLVTGVNIPVTITRKGNVVYWEEFSSPKSLILPIKTRSATTQSVVLAACVQQLEQAFEQKKIRYPKKLGIVLYHIWDTDLQKRTGFVRRPQLLF